MVRNYLTSIVVVGVMILLALAPALSRTVPAAEFHDDDESVYYPAEGRGAQSITMVYPNGGEVFSVGQMVDLEWSNYNVSDFVLQYKIANAGSHADYVCDDGSTIAFGLVNEGNDDCPDGSDEPNWFSCPVDEEHDPMSIAVAFLNDGHDHCPDGSDEDDGAGTMEYECKDGTTITFTMANDGNKDCADGTDEGIWFPCYDGLSQTPVVLVNDNWDDCADGSDESGGGWVTITEVAGPPNGTTSQGWLVPDEESTQVLIKIVDYNFSVTGAEDESDSYFTIVGEDSDGDGVGDSNDDCPDEDASGWDTNGDGCIDDSDGDGLYDPDDLCPNENATDYDVDGDGCIDDSDGDGVKDNIDLCKGENATGWDTDGDGCIDDTDGDGVFDDNDLCPSEDSTGFDLDGDGCLDDSDGDGVNDAVDACPTEDATGQDIDGDGCIDPVDSDADGDGVLDSDDTCPIEDATGHDVDGDGCIDDSDGDSVNDVDDLCPDTSTGESVDSDGCSESQLDTGTEPSDNGTEQLDSDSDGVIDDLDACADTPAGVEVDDKGCTKQVQVAPESEDGMGFLMIFAAALLGTLVLGVLGILVSMAVSSRRRGPQIPAGLPPSIVEPEPAPSSEVPAGAPPLPDGGLPEGWSMEQWVHYGEEYLRRR